MTDARQVTDAFVTDVGKVATALGLFASTIKSGENWTTACEQANREAHDALRRLAARAPVQAADEEAGAISVQDPLSLVESLIQFGPSHDGAVERDLRAAIRRLMAERDEMLARTLINRREIARLRIDIGTLLANIRHLEEVTGEAIEGEDAEIVAEIEREHRAVEKAGNARSALRQSGNKT